LFKLATFNWLSKAKTEELSSTLVFCSSNIYTVSTKVLWNIYFLK
jgi:hypothetical protein